MTPGNRRTGRAAARPTTPVVRGTVHGALLVAAGVLVAGALTGCTTTAPLPVVTSAAFPQIPQGSGVVAGSSMSRCDVTPGAVVASGSFTLPEGSADEVVVSVSWVDASTSVVYARGLATITGARAGQAQSWSIDSTLPAVDAPLTCVMGAVIPD